MTDPAKLKNAQRPDLLDDLTEALLNIKASDIDVIDVRGKTSLMDTLVIASGTSTRHLAAVVESVALELGAKGYVAHHQEGQAGSDWVLLDFIDLVLHVMLPEARQRYDLEGLWSASLPAQSD